MSVKVSILVAGYNYLAHLNNIRAVLKKLCQQDNVEVIFVDDHSTDGCYLQIQSFKFDILKIVKNGENLGLTKSLNIAAQYATGDIFVRWDVDDSFDDDRISEVRLADSCGFNFHVMDAICINSNGHIINRLLVPKSKMLSRFVALRRNPFIHGGTSFRRELFFMNDGYNEDYKYAQDYEFWTRLLQFKDLRLKKISAKYRLLIHNESISSLKKDAQRHYFLSARKKYWRNILSFKSASL